MLLARSRLEVLRRAPLDNGNGLTGWWPLDNDASDLSGSNNVGTLVGSPPLVPGPGRAMGISLDGSSQRVSTTTNFGNASTLKTVSIGAWFKTTSVSGVPFVMLNELADGSSINTDRGLYIGTDGKVNGYAYDGALIFAASTAAYNDGLWHYAVTTIAENDSLKLYVDAVFQSSMPIRSPFTGYVTSYWVIGRAGGATGPNSTVGFFTGSVADVKVYQYRTLSPGEVSDEYNRVLAGYAVRPDEWEMPALSPAAAAPTAVNFTNLLLSGVG